MYTVQVRDGKVEGVVVVHGDREPYARHLGVEIVDVPDGLVVQPGDTYDGQFYRDGQPLFAVQARSYRDSLLRQSDYTQVLDFPCTEEERAAWKAYRQALRDVPQQTDFPEAIEWPLLPGMAEQGA